MNPRPRGARDTRIGRHISRRAALARCLPAVVALLCAGCGHRSTPEELFRETVLNPVPASVHIVHAQRNERMDNVEVWIHFKIAPADFAAILQSDPYRNLGDSQLNYSAYDPPAWWTPDRLGPNKSHFDCETTPHYRRDRSAKNIVVNAAEDEVLFLMRSWSNY